MPLSSTTSFDIAIHGTGLVARALALLLAKSGFKVALIGTPSPQADTDIRAFSLNKTSKILLERLAAWPAETHVTPVMSMSVFGDAGGSAQFESSPKSEQTTEPLNWIVDVPALVESLQAATAAEPCIKRLAAGDAVQAKLDVLCEGASAMRLNQLGVQAHTIRYAQHALAARLACERPHNHTAYQWFNERGEVLAFLPMQGQQVALVWSLTSDLAKSMQSAPEAEFTLALEAASRHKLGVMTLCSERALWPLQLTRTSNWVGEQDGHVWVLAGDAAHKLHPLAGQGLNLGLGDAALLADTLKAFLTKSPLFYPTATALTRSLNQYARARLAAAAQMSSATDGLQLLFAHQNPLVKQARNWGMTLFNRAKNIKRQVIQRAQ